jgi:hypothetical protein
MSSELKWCSDYPVDALEIINAHNWISEPCMSTEGLTCNLCGLEAYKDRACSTDNKINTYRVYHYIGSDIYITCNERVIKNIL